MRIIKSFANLFFILILKIFTRVKISFYAKLPPNLFVYLLRNNPGGINLRNALIGRGGVVLSEGVTFYHKAEVFGSVKIGRFTSISGPGTRICAVVNHISIGSFCSIASGVVIQEFYHNTKLPTTYNIVNNVIKNNKLKSKQTTSKGAIIIEDDVWIGSNSVILSGTKIGRGAIIGAGSIVTKDIEPYSIVAGNPAKKIKDRFTKETIKVLEDAKWWDWSVDKIKIEEDFFSKTRE